MKRANLLLFLVIFLEGYAVLSTELLAIRQVMPFAGSAADVIAIVIAAVLMPLAFGYEAGGRFKPHIDRDGKAQTIRNRLLLNLAFSSIVLAIGLSHATSKLFFNSLVSVGGIFDKQILVGLYSLVFIVLPVFLLGQTVPLVSNYFRRQHLSTFAGRILFYSTMGSFCGSIFCTLVLMPTIGLHKTVILTILCLAILTVLLSRKPFNRYVLGTVIALLISASLNSTAVLRHLNIVRDDQYMTIQVYDAVDEAARFMQINSTRASGISTDPAKQDHNIFAPLDYIERQYIYSRPASAPPIDILMIGAGGFTLGLADAKNNYTFLDINPALKDISESAFLKQKLGANKKFIPEEARAFLATTKDKFDLVVLDPYQDFGGIPLGLVTREFFEEVDSIMKPGAILTANAYTSSNFADNFTIRFDNTIRSVFPNLNRVPLTPYNGWQLDPPQYANVIFTAFKRTAAERGIYTDDLNRSYLDKRKVQK